MFNMQCWIEGNCVFLFVSSTLLLSFTSGSKDKIAEAMVFWLRSFFCLTSCCFQHVQRRVLLPHLNLSAPAFPQPQHQIRAQLSRAHVLPQLPSSAPPQAALANEQPGFCPPYPSGSLPGQWGEGVPQSWLPTGRRGAAAQAAGDKWRVAEIAGCCSPAPSPVRSTSPVVSTEIKPRRWSPFSLHRHLFLLTQSWSHLGDGELSLYHLFDPMRREIQTFAFCLVVALPL